MKLTFMLRFTCLLLLGLMAGGALSFVARWNAAFESVSAVSAVGYQSLLITSGAYTSVVIYALILTGMFLDLICMRSQWKSPEFILVLFAMICIADEGLMTYSGNLPLNRWLPVMDLGLPPISWLEVQTQWVKFMYIRSALLVTSFALLLASTFFMKGTLSSRQDVVVVA